VFVPEMSLVNRLRSLLDPLPASPQETVGHAAVLLALTDEAEPQLWMIRRAYHLMLHAGQIAFPGGKGEAADQDLWQTALREAEEEVALPQQCVAVCGTLTIRRTLTGYNVAPFVGLVPPGLVLAADPNEVSALVRFPLAAFADRKNLFVDRVWRGSTSHTLPRYQIGSFMVWGMTASFIVELVNRFHNAGFDGALHAPPPPHFHKPASFPVTPVLNDADRKEQRNDL
jgi:8-oxo-dGTP pyrophosphatase MutT (NUDIX family)